MPGKISLFVPGPTNMPDRVRQAMDISNEDHRAPGMEKFWHPLVEDLRKVFETTSGQPFILILTTECALVDIKEDTPAAPPMGGGGMPGMM